MRSAVECPYLLHRAMDRPDDDLAVLAQVRGGAVPYADAGTLVGPSKKVVLPETPEEAYASRASGHA